MGIMRIQDRSGDSVMEWDVADEAAVKAAEKVFNDLLAKQHLGYKKTVEGGEVLRRFDPTAEEIVVAIPLVGG